jgi:hypothetical protein
MENGELKRQKAESRRQKGELANVSEASCMGRMLAVPFLNYRFISSACCGLHGFFATRQAA